MFNLLLNLLKTFNPLLNSLKMFNPLLNSLIFNPLLNPLKMFNPLPRMAVQDGRRRVMMDGMMLRHSRPIRMRNGD
jgi:hypothetical protein